MTATPSRHTITLIALDAAYDTFGRTYTATRRTDPRIAAAVWEALGAARTVVNVGAGTGSYEPLDRWVLAVEPSETMLRQRGSGAAPAIRATAEALPLADGTVDAAMALMTIHHWADWRAGIAELRRVARSRVVVWTFEPDQTEALWLVRDYLPEVRDLDTGRTPPVADVAEALGGAEIRTVEIPRDCEDGVLAAYYARPEAYLDPRVRAGMSPFHVLATTVVDAAMERLAEDLRSGLWDERYGALRERPSLDAGYRLVVASL